MEAYIYVLNFAIPFFVVLLLLEAFVAKRKDAKVIRSIDTLSSLSSGITNVIKDVLGLTVIIVSYQWVEARIGIFEIEANWWTFVIAFIGIDFAGYWVHRISHQVNYFWNHHIIHHSSEEFNLGCALRQTISAWFSITVFFLLPIAILGVPPEVVAIVQPLHLFAQYWYHTRLIGKMGFLEKIIVTPSHHRVHHAINKEYLDKNLAQIFIVWDKWFGTFQEELEDVQPVYGVKRPVRTWNPIIINFTHLWLLVRDAWYTRSWADKFKIWFKPTGWRPADVAEKFPVKIIEDVYGYEKYDSQASKRLLYWSWFQFVVIFAMMMYMFNNIAAIGFGNALAFGSFLVFSVFSFTMLMDKHPWSLITEFIRVTIAGMILWMQGDWFLLGTVMPGGEFIATAYFVLSLVATYYLHQDHVGKAQPVAA